MFKPNKYTKIYNLIIARAKTRTLKGYKETHHIIPKCLGGSNTQDNLVELTAREHFICHLLLTKMHDDNGLKFAIHKMMFPNNDHQSSRYVVKTSRLFEAIKILHSEACSFRNKNRVYSSGYKTFLDENGAVRRVNDGDFIPDGWKRGSGTSGKSVNKGRVYYHDPSTKETKALLADDVIPAGWVKGNPGADTSGVNGIRGTSYYHNPTTGEEIRSNTCPEGWISGRVIKWITNGKCNKQHNLTTKVPEGYWFGRTNKSGYRQNRN